MALDVAKGATAVALAHMSSGGAPLAAVTGAAAVVGHIYPVWLRFHGGKGVAVAAGVFSVLAPIATAVAAGAVRGNRLADALRVPRIDCRDRSRCRRWRGWPARPVRSSGPRGGQRPLILFRHRANLRRPPSRHRAPDVVGQPNWRRMTRGRAERIAILGAGSWGTALAVHCAATGHDVRLWARDDTLVDGDPRATAINPRYLTDDHRS